MPSAPKYERVGDTNVATVTIRSAKDVRMMLGINPISKETERRFTPWYVSLPIIPSSLLGIADRKGIFTYGKNQTEAMSRCGLFWNHYFRQIQGLPDEAYPKLAQYDPARPADTGVICVSLDDNDFDNFWKVCRKMPHYAAGDQESPITFCPANDVDIFELA